MITEEQKKKYLLKQSQQRAVEGSPARTAMLEWGKSEKGKRDYKKWFEKRGREVTARYRKKRRASNRDAENARQRWTLTEEKKLVEFVAKGMTHEEIAKKLKRSISSVDHKYSRLKRDL